MISPEARIYRLEQEILALKRRLYRVGNLAAGGGGATSLPFRAVAGSGLS